MKKTLFLLSMVVFLLCSCDLFNTGIPDFLDDGVSISSSGDSGIFAQTIVAGMSKSGTVDFTIPIEFYASIDSLTIAAKTADSSNNFSFNEEYLMEGVTFYYTIDGSEPTTSSYKVEGSELSLSELGDEDEDEYTVKMIAVKEGYTNSAAVTATYTKNGVVISPTISPVGYFQGSVDVYMISATEGAKIYYTTNGDIPSVSSTPYTDKFTITETTTVKAIAIYAGLDNSAVSNAEFTKNGEVIRPRITPGSGSYQGSVDVEITSGTSNAKIYYTTDATVPSISSTPYTDKFTITETTTINAIAIYTGLKDSHSAYAEFTIGSGGGTGGGTGKAVARMSVPTGIVSFATTIEFFVDVDSLIAKTAPTSRSVAIDSDENGVDKTVQFYYTTDGISDPDPENTETTYTGASLTLSDLGEATSYTVKVIAVKAGYENSEVVTEKYTKATLGLPTFNTGKYFADGSDNLMVEISTTNGAEIRYTTDGTEPKGSSTLYNNITITDTTTIKAIAVKDGYINSSIIEAKFIKPLMQTFPVHVKKDTFTMGGYVINIKNGKPYTSGKQLDSLPAHEVQLTQNFIIAEYEVTQGQWEKIMGWLPPGMSGVGDNYPVHNISWYDAVMFCNALSKEEGYEECYTITKNGTDQENWTVKWDDTKNGYRLPTEAEWEYAAGGGMDKRNKENIYPGSKTYKGVFNVTGGGGGSAKPVGSYDSFNDLYDMGGNVREWCWDWNAPYTVDSDGQKIDLRANVLHNSKTNPKGPDEAYHNDYLKSDKNHYKEGRVMRGGSFRWNIEYAQVVCRNQNDLPHFKVLTAGFRVIRSID